MQNVWSFQIWMRTALFCVITQEVLVLSYRRFGTTYRSHLQGSGISYLSANWSMALKCS